MKEGRLEQAGDRWQLHFTPKHASWMNQVEIWLSILVRKVLKQIGRASCRERV